MAESVAVKPVPVEGKLASLYFDVFESKAFAVLKSGSRFDDDDKVVNFVMDSKEFRIALENITLMTKSSINSIIRTLLDWRAKVTQGHTVGSTHVRERHDLCADAVLARSLTHILLHYETWLSYCALQISNKATDQLTLHTQSLSELLVSRIKRWHEDGTSPASTEGRRRVCDAFLEIIGLISANRFQESTKFIVEQISRHLRADGTAGKIADREVFLSVRLLRLVRIPTEACTSLQSVYISEFLKILVSVAINNKGKNIRRAVCETLISILAPLSGQRIPAFIGVFKPFMSKLEKWFKKNKHVMIAIPLYTVLLCISEEDKIENHIDSLLKKLSEDAKDRERRLRTTLLDSLLHALGYLTVHQSGLTIPSSPPRYVPPPPIDDCKVGDNTQFLQAHGEQSQSPGSKSTDKSSQLPPRIVTKLKQVGKLIASTGKKQMISQGSNRAFTLSIDIFTMITRLSPQEGINLIASLLGTAEGTKISQHDIATESMLVGLYSLLAMAQLSEHYHPQGAVEEHGVSQGIPLPWWSLGNPSRSSGGDLHVRIRTPFTSYRPPSPMSANLWSADKCCSPSGGGIWTLSTTCLILDTSTLCQHSVLNPLMLHSKLTSKGDELSQRLAAIIFACEKECRGRKDDVGKDPKTSEKHQKDSLHVFRIALLASVYIQPQCPSYEYCTLIVRLVIHPSLEIRETVTNTVIPQLLVVRPTLRVSLMGALAELLLSVVDDMETSLTVLNCVTKIFNYINSIVKDSQAVLPGAHTQGMTPRQFKGISQMDPLTPRPVVSTPRKVSTPRVGTPLVTPRSTTQSTGTERRGDVVDYVSSLEAACLVLLAAPLVDVRIRSLTLLHTIEKSTLVPLHSRVATLLEDEILEADLTASSIILNLRETGADWLESRDHKRIIALTPVTLDQGLERSQTPAGTMDSLSVDLPQTALTRMVVGGDGNWQYCLGVFMEILSDVFPAVSAIACRAIYPKLQLLLSKVIDSQGTVDRRKTELSQGYSIIMAASCNRQWDVIPLLISMLRSSIQDIADVGVFILHIVPRSGTAAVLDALRQLDSDLQKSQSSSQKRDKAKRQAWLLRGHLIKGYSAILKLSYPKDWKAYNMSHRLVTEWIDEQLSIISKAHLQGKLSSFDQQTVLRCRADILTLISVASVKFHQHGPDGNPFTTGTTDKEGVTHSGSHHNSRESVRSRSGELSFSAILNTDITDSILSLTKNRATDAACNLLCGPLPVSVDMVWSELYAAGRAPGQQQQQQQQLTFQKVISFLHSLLPQTIRTSVRPQPISNSFDIVSSHIGPSPSRRSDGNGDKFTAPFDGVTRVTETLKSVMKCNLGSHSLVRVSCLMTLHSSESISRLHLLALADIIRSGETVVFQTPSIPIILAAVVSYLLLPAIDDELLLSAWYLVSVISPKVGKIIASGPSMGMYDHSYVKKTIKLLARYLPEAGLVLVPLVRERIPKLQSARQVALLSILTYWSPFIKLDYTDVDEFISLTEKCYPAYPHIVSGIWKSLPCYSSIVTRIVSYSQRYIESEAEVALVCPPGNSHRRQALSLASIALRLLPTSTVDDTAHLIVNLLHVTPIKNNASRAEHSYFIRASAAIFLLSEILLRVSKSVYLSKLHSIIHAAAVVGLNHFLKPINIASRKLLKFFINDSCCSLTASKDLQRCRSSFIDLLTIRTGTDLQVTEPFILLVISSQPMDINLFRSWVITALEICKIPTAVIGGWGNIRKTSLMVYQALSDKLSYAADSEFADKRIVLLLEAYLVAGEEGDGDFCLQLMSNVLSITESTAFSNCDKDIVWTVLLLVKCTSIPELVKLCAQSAIKCIPRLSISAAHFEAPRVIAILRSVLSQLYLVPVDVNDILVSLLVVLVSHIHCWLPKASTPHYQALIVAALLPEIGIRYNVHSAPGAMLSTLASVCEGPIGVSITQRSNKPLRSTTDTMHRLTEALSDKIWGGYIVNDYEVMELYTHLVKSEAMLSESVLPWVLRITAHLLMTPALQKVGVSSTSLTPLLVLLPSLSGASQSHAARCLSLAALREKPSSGMIFKKSNPPGTLILSSEETSPAAVSMVLHGYLRRSVKVNDQQEGLKIDPPSSTYTGLSKGILQYNDEDDKLGCKNINDDLSLDETDDVTGTDVSDVGIGRYNRFDGDFDFLSTVDNFAKESQQEFDSSSDHSDTESDVSSDSFDVVDDQFYERCENIILESNLVNSLLVMSTRGVLCCLVRPCSLSLPTDVQLYSASHVELIMSEISMLLTAENIKNKIIVRLSSDCWSYSNGLLRQGSNISRRVSVLHRYESIFNNMRTTVLKNDI